ncbi:hypothetical protein Vretimale_16127 [Volvox reticuliferus]|uniref:SRCR domain-containing protein n=1 Tax=Volvox reticuliferus TaxID=1737510 RepID=A0A8J4GTG6_9CHLO|nr:hypothetical protein Vretimale_16127 [Volvox reticuliferus]
MNLGLLVAVLLVLQVAPDLGLAQTPREYRYKNGIRLAGDTGTKGRLEVSSIDAWFTDVPGKASWSPVCDTGDFGDADATIMCKLLDYTYGRKFYSKYTSAPRSQTDARYVGRIICEEKIFNPPPPARSPPSRARSRSLFRPLQATINTPTASPYTCRIRPGPCDNNGPFVGIECSHFPMDNASPPPPSPPAPPPSPPAVSNFIRFYGPQMTWTSNVFAGLEPNLVNEDALVGIVYGRFEVQVASPVDGRLVWAPLCYYNDTADALYVGNTLMTTADVACQQLHDWPKQFDGGIALVMVQVSDTQITIPSAAYGEDDFDPKKVAAWVTVLGGGLGASARKVQDMNIAISSTPCKSGALLTAVCQPFGERHRRN